MPDETRASTTLPDCLEGFTAILDLPSGSPAPVFMDPPDSWYAPILDVWAGAPSDSLAGLWYSYEVASEAANHGPIEHRVNATERAEHLHKRMGRALKSRPNVFFQVKNDLAIRWNALANRLDARKVFDGREVRA